MKTINVKTSAEYDVYIGENLLSRTGEFALRVKKPCRAVIVSDDKVYPLYGETVKKSLEDVGFTVYSYAFENGEKSKTLATFAEILEYLAECRLTRTDLVVALGGGVVGDMAGFCAATYLRGIDFIQIPTSLLAAVDSSVGGKTAVDLAAGKNLAGAFHQPISVVCDVATFSTLDPNQLASGFAEVIKYGVICDTELFSLLEAGSPDYTELCARCIGIKRDVVEKDEFEKGDRKFLNLGHTLGHAVEKHSNFSLTHGASVAVGMMMIAKISEKAGYAKENITPRLADLLKKYGLPTEYSITADELYDIACGDKKVSGSDITAVIPEQIGKCLLEKMPMTQFRKLINLAL